MKIITNKVRFSYPQLFEAKSFEGQEAKFSVSIIIPKSDKTMLAKIEKAIQAALVEGKDTKFGGKIPTNFRTPLRNGDEERPENPEYADSMFINVKSNRRPDVVDENLLEIIDPEKIYPGCYGKVSMNSFPYIFAKKMGVSFALVNAQFLGGGDRLGASKASAKDDFGGGSLA